jgi:prephenate dehydrogenase
LVLAVLVGKAALPMVLTVLTLHFQQLHLMAAVAVALIAQDCLAAQAVVVVCPPQAQLLEVLETLHQHHRHKVVMVGLVED